MLVHADVLSGRSRHHLVGVFRGEGLHHGRSAREVDVQLRVARHGEFDTVEYLFGREIAADSVDGDCARAGLGHGPGLRYCSSGYGRRIET